MKPSISKYCLFHVLWQLLFNTAICFLKNIKAYMYSLHNSFFELLWASSCFASGGLDVHWCSLLHDVCDVCKQCEQQRKWNPRLTASPVVLLRKKEFICWCYLCIYILLFTCYLKRINVLFPQADHNSKPVRKRF